MHPSLHFPPAGVLLGMAGLFGAATACDNPNSLPDPTVVNVVDTVTLTALSNPNLQAPDAFSIITGSAVKTWQTSSFDFVFTVDGAGQSSFLPPVVLGMRLFATTNPGLQQTATLFDAITFAPVNGYIEDDTVHVAVGDRLVGHTGLICSIGVPIYAKFEVLAIDLTAQTITFQVLADNNCGYLGLEPGLPPS